jgi:hypothetical protein
MPCALQWSPLRLSVCMQAQCHNMHGMNDQLHALKRLKRIFTLQAHNHKRQAVAMY